MPIMKNMSRPLRASIDMTRCLGVGDSASKVPGNSEVRSVVGEAIEDILCVREKLHNTWLALTQALSPRRGRIVVGAAENP
jgi:hypothetical protein